MQTSQVRAEVIVQLRARANKHVATRLSEREAVQLALASSMRDPDEVIGFLMPHYLAKLAVQQREQLKLSTTEWNALFGVGAYAIKDGGVASIVGSPEFAPQLSKLSNALKTTILEKEQSVVWDRAWSKLLCYIAMHLDVAEDALVGVLGTVIKADNRRIEEFFSSIDDDGPEVMLVARCVVALSECIA